MKLNTNLSTSLYTKSVYMRDSASLVAQLSASICIKSADRAKKLLLLLLQLITQKGDADANCARHITTCASQMPNNSQAHLVFWKCLSAKLCL